jgi:small subunit ribosomal protein S8
MVSDSIADMFSRIRNASSARLATLEMPSSKITAAIAKILQDEGFVERVEIGDGPRQTLRITLKYNGDRAHRMPAIKGIRRSSRPGRRLYVAHDSIPRVHSGLGIAILSTSHGVMTDRDARQQRVGGELVGEVW